MTRQYNKQFFELQTGDKKIYFFCYTTNTRLGFCHTVVTLHDNFYTKVITDTKNSYYNRTWERYEYESTLKRACEKAGKNIYNLAFVKNNLKRSF